MPENYSNNRGGIYAHNVNAKVIAVGDNASATGTIYNISDNKHILQSLAELKQELQARVSDEGKRRIVEKDVKALEEMVNSNTIDNAKAKSMLETIADKVKLVTSVISDVTSLTATIQKIAAAIGVY